MNAIFRIGLMLGTTVILLAGCVREDMRDLQTFTEQAYKDRKPSVEPLPRIRPHETFVYTASELADPFSAENLRERKPTAGKSGLAPDTNRRKQPLERYPLDGLAMVGTLTREESWWVILRAPDGTIHRAAEGNYIGQSFGVITKISEDKIDVKELVQDSGGSWIERQASIAVIE
ncbi:MAG: pilus assembly protein PilP [Gammaproteobacteria bacterium]|nr:pilus assembly protein PilP [Gammaproteobacteria bacterium]